ncbi:MAG TPA: response regulator [Prolixibacteraceae bacterium]|nr:response regulator [Prolixibacteraceae bacterium]
MYKKLAIVIVILILKATSLFSSDVVFHNINNRYGLSIRETNSVCRDHNGFIWASAKTGILRISGNSYRLYPIPYEKANIITIKLTYNNNTLIAFTNNGQVFLYNEITDRFELYHNIVRSTGIDYLVINNLYTNGDTHWAATTAGLFYLKGDKIVRISRDDTRDIIPYKNNKLLLAKNNQILVLDSDSQTETPIYTNTTENPFIIFTMHYDALNDQLWVGTASSGLYCYDFTTKKMNAFNNQNFPKQLILAIESTSENSLLVGFDGQGLWEIDKKTTKIKQVFLENPDDNNSIIGNGIYDIFCEPNNRVWVCTYSGGLSYFEKNTTNINVITHQSNNSQSLLNNNVNHIIEDSKGNIWFATNNGISRFSPKNNTWRSFFNNNEQATVFFTMYEDTKGQIWAGTFLSGVYIFDSETGKIISHLFAKKGSETSITSAYDIFEDSDGDIWLGDADGRVLCYNSANNKFDTFPNAPLKEFGQIEPGKVLMACTTGLYVVDKSTGKHVKILGNYLLNDILVYNHYIWLCTNGEGLVKLDPKSGKTENYTVQNGLPTNFINSIVYAEGFLWIGTEYGLCRFNPIDESIVSFSTLLPLSTSSFNRKAGLKLKNGQLAFGTNKGAVFFDPNKLKERNSEAKIYIEDISVSGRSIRNNINFSIQQAINTFEELKLNYRQNNINIELLSLGEALNTKFSWRLLGLDNEWNIPSDLNIVSYANIPSKKYQLEIRLYDSTNNHILDERMLSITITPPFWASWWFFIVAFVIISLVILFVTLYYIDKIRQKHTEEKVRFFTNIAHDIRTSLTLIKAPVDELNNEKNLSEKGRYYLKLATKEANHLSSVATQLMDFQKVDIGKEKIKFQNSNIVALIGNRVNMYHSLAEQQKIKLKFNSNTKQFISAVDELMIEKVCDNLISNAIKYSHQNTNVNIELFCADNQWRLTVSDEGIGIKKSDQKMLFREFYRAPNAINKKISGSGIGLLLCKTYINMHGGRITFKSEENAGSSFSLTVPQQILATQNNTQSNTQNIASPLSIKTAKSEKTKNETDINNDKILKILIVEDNDDLREFMARSLDENYSILLANDGIEALELTQKVQPDLIISDVMMPNMNGFELCQKLKSNYETAHIPLILLSALTEQTEQLHGLGLGADDYLTKPFEINFLKEKIKSIIRNRLAIRDKLVNYNNEKSPEPILSNKLNNEFLEKMMEAIQQNISNQKFDKEEFASALNVSTSLLYKKTKALTGQSPLDIIKSVRMDYAFKLLESGQYSITEVSELCGYTSVGYFSTVFRKHFGKKPSDMLV